MNKTEQFWDKMADHFDQQATNFEQPPLEKAKKYLKKSDVVLDFGCATGTIAIEIASRVKSIYGIDLSSKMIEAAKRKATTAQVSNVQFAQSTIDDPTLVKESFDVILAFNIFHLVEDIPSVMRRINELLKPEGLVISITACTGEKKTFLNVLLSFLIKIGIIPEMRFFSISELRESMALGNFQLIETELMERGASNYFIVAKK